MKTIRIEDLKNRPLQELEEMYSSAVQTFTETTINGIENDPVVHDTDEDPVRFAKDLFLVVLGKRGGVRFSRDGGIDHHRV